MANRSFSVGTRRTCTTPFRHRGRWDRPSAPASTSTRERGSQCEPVTRCAQRLAALTTPPQRWSSPGNLPTVSKLMYHMRIKETSLDQDLLVAFDVQLRGLCQRLAQRGLAGPLLVAGQHWRHLRWTGPPDGAGDCVPRLRPPPLQPCRRRPEPAHHGRVRRAHRLDASAHAGSASTETLTKPLVEREFSWHNFLSGIEDAMQDQPTPSLRHARGITPDDGDGDDEHPPGPETLEDSGRHHQLRGHERASGPASDARAGRLLGGPVRGCRNLGDAEVDHTWNVALEPAPRCCDGARRVR